MDTLKLFKEAVSLILMDDSFSIETEGNTICLENLRHFITLLTENSNKLFVHHLFLNEVKKSWKRMQETPQRSCGAGNTNSEVVSGV